MNTQGCPEYTELVAQIRSGSLGEGTRTHVDSCEVCGATARLIRDLATLADGSSRAPSAGDIYWRARARKELDASSRSTWRVAGPLRYFHFGVGVVLVVSSIVIAVSPNLFGDLGMVAPLPLLAAVGGAYLLSFGVPESPSSI